MKSRPVCKRCKKPLEKHEYRPQEGRFFCSDCMIKLAEQHIPEKPRIFKAPPGRGQKKKILKLAVVAGCSVLVLVNSIVLARVLARGGSKEFVPPDVSKDAILCLSNLERIGELLQEDELPSDSIVCPLSGAPYRVQIDGREVIVRCPNPESHLLYGLHVSKRDPVPKVDR